MHMVFIPCKIRSLCSVNWKGILLPMTSPLTDFFAPKLDPIGWSPHAGKAIPAGNRPTSDKKIGYNDRIYLYDPQLFSSGSNSKWSFDIPTVVEASCGTQYHLRIKLDSLQCLEWLLGRKFKIDLAQVLVIIILVWKMMKDFSKLYFYRVQWPAYLWFWGIHKGKEGFWYDLK